LLEKETDISVAKRSFFWTRETCYVTMPWSAKHQICYWLSFYST